MLPPMPTSRSPTHRRGTSGDAEKETAGERTETVRERWLTLTDKAIPYWVWFTMGFAVVSMMLGIANFGLIVVAVITLKGLYIPAWAVVVIGLAVAAFCVGVGWFFIRYDIQNRITHYLNANANPQINQIQDDLNAIKKRLEIEWTVRLLITI
jgi:hypothetical protein